MCFRSFKKFGSAWFPKQPFFNGCFGWMMNQISTWEMGVSPNLHLEQVV